MEITKEKVLRYFAVTEKALEKAKGAPENLDVGDARVVFLDMVERYIADARHFVGKEDLVDAFAAINYAHGWLDAGARIGLWDVGDSSLFVVDDKS